MAKRGRQSPEAQKKRSESLKKYYSEHPELRVIKSIKMKANRHSGNFKKGMTPWNKGKKFPAITGERNSNWKGGIVSKEKLERNKFRATQQLLVFQRDNYTCQNCQQYGGSLQVDHIKGWADYPEFRFDLDNCRTLCMACHYFVTFKRKLPEGVIWGHNLSKRVVS